MSAIYRMTMLQVAVPDNMRGRLHGVFTVLVRVQRTFRHYDGTRPTP